MTNRIKKLQQLAKITNAKALKEFTEVELNVEDITFKTNQNGEISTILLFANDDCFYSTSTSVRDNLLMLKDACEGNYEGVKISFRTESTRNGNTTYIMTLL